MSAKPNIAILILAAGQSRRMGGCDKLVLPLQSGISLLEDRIQVAGKSDIPVFVAVGPEQKERHAIVAKTEAVLITCDQANNGLGHSLSQALGTLVNTSDVPLDAVMILLADMPAITTADILSIQDHYHPDLVIRGATQAMSPGHPTLIPFRSFEAIMALEGDQGAQAVLRNAPTTLVPLAGDSALLDIDTPDDWKAWLAR